MLKKFDAEARRTYLHDSAVGLQLRGGEAGSVLQHLLALNEVTVGDPLPDADVRQIVDSVFPGTRTTAPTSTPAATAPNSIDIGFWEAPTTAPTSTPSAADRKLARLKDVLQSLEQDLRIPGQGVLRTVVSQMHKALSDEEG